MMFKMTSIRSYKLAKLMTIITFLASFFFGPLISLSIFYMTFYSINFTTEHVPFIVRNTGLFTEIAGGILIIIWTAIFFYWWPKIIDIMLKYVKGLKDKTDSLSVSNRM